MRGNLLGVAFLLSALGACSGDPEDDAGPGQDGGAGSAGQAGSGGAGGSNGCGSAERCVASVPAGFSGPVVVFQGDPQSPPSCADAGLPPAFELYRNETFPPADCPCSCAKPQVSDCRANLVLAASGASCTDSTQTHELGSSCKEIGVDATSAEVTSTELVGSCTPMNGQPSFGPADSGEVLVGCDLTTGSQVCALGRCSKPPGAPFEQVCIYTEGIAPCPQGVYSQRRQVHAVSDERACEPCACGAAEGGSCTANVRVFTGSGCSSGSTTITTSCKSFVPQGSQKVASGRVDAYTVSASGSCPVTGGQPTGAVIATKTYTVCCEPSSK